MFLCISANPAIDKRLRVSELRLGAVNRVLDAIPEPGGKAAGPSGAVFPFLNPARRIQDRLP